MPSGQRQQSDRHPWLGQVPVHIESPTFAIPPDCLCTWSVVRPGVGWNCISQLRFMNSLCPIRHYAAARKAAGNG